MNVAKKIRMLVPEEDDTSMWMLPFSALMLILMIFFAALYGFSQLGSMEYERAIAMLENTDEKTEVSDTVKEVLLAAGLRDYIEKENLSAVAGVSISPLWIKLELSSPALFDSGSAELKPAGWPLLRELAKHQKHMANVLIVEGHTDNVPIRSERFQSNWELSAARAFTVLQFFVSEGIEPKRLAAHGYGEFRPLVPNDSEENRGRNRRIEITIPRGEYRL